MLGVTGGIAAYKAAELVRLLVKQDVEVQVVMTEAACQFITPATLQALSGEPVFTDLWDDRIDNGMAHIDLTRDADAVVVAPASADFIAKLAHGAADDLLSTLCLARDVPAAGRAGDEPADVGQARPPSATSRRLDDDGIAVLGPDSGDQACGETGMGRMLEAQDLLARRSKPSSSPSCCRQACADHRRPDLRSHRRGARHHQFEFGQDGLCRGARGASKPARK